MNTQEHRTRARQRLSMREIQHAHRDNRVSLRPRAIGIHETGEDMYGSYGWHISSDIFGHCELQTVEYGWLDDGIADQYAISGTPLDGCSFRSKEELLGAARAVWPGANIHGDYLYDGDQEIAEVKFLPADPVLRTILALGWPDSSESDDTIESERQSLAEDLVDRARSIREDMDSIESLLDDAVAAYDEEDLEAVIEALQLASRAENDHGDDPATSELIHDLLQITRAAEVDR